MRALLIALTLTAAPALAIASQAQPAAAPTRAVVADAAQLSGNRVIVDGAAWRCEGTLCVSNGSASQPAPRACRRVRAKLGPLTEFAWRGRVLTAAELATCNA